MFYAYTAHCTVASRQAARRYRGAAAHALDKSWFRFMEHSKYQRMCYHLGNLINGNVERPETKGVS